MTTPYNGQPVQTSGTVTLDFDDRYQQGFFIQDENCDGDPQTSDGIFIYLDQKIDIVSPGDRVTVSGWAVEFDGRTEIEVDSTDVVQNGAGPLPSPVPFSPPPNAALAASYTESHEGMRISQASAHVVGPTNSRGESFLVDIALGIRRVLRGDPTGAVMLVDEAGPKKIVPHVKVGDTVIGLTGVLNEEQDYYRLHLDAVPVVQLGTPPGIGVQTPAGAAFASLNLHNLFDSIDDPNTQDPVLSPGAYQTRLEKLARTIGDLMGLPRVIAVQEAENAAVLQALANRPELPNQYAFTLFDGPDIRGIDVGILYDPQYAALLSSQPRQGCTALVDGLGPDGNGNPTNPQNNKTCSLPGQPGFLGNRLFSRPPLVAELEICGQICSPGIPGDTYWVIAVHLKSKSQDTKTVQYTLPRRVEQAEFLAGLAADIQSSDPEAKVILLGDFNDYVISQPTQALEDVGLVNLMRWIPRPDRYTYIYDGISQVLDHAFSNQAFVQTGFFSASPVHSNADYPAALENDPSIPARASDHDPILVFRRSFSYQIFLPLVP